MKEIKNHILNKMSVSLLTDEFKLTYSNWMYADRLTLFIIITFIGTFMNLFVIGKDTIHNIISMNFTNLTPDNQIILFVAFGELLCLLCISCFKYYKANKYRDKLVNLIIDKELEYLTQEDKSIFNAK